MSNQNWISFKDRMPKPAYDTKNSGPTHGLILVTNCLDSRDRWGNMDHVWLSSMVIKHDVESTFNGEVRGEVGEVTAFAYPGYLQLRNLTHWRPAVPEEWEGKEA